MSSIVTPIDQLFQLNKEILEANIRPDTAIVVIGGQVIGYWLQYFREAIDTVDTKLSDARSSDIDYMMSLKTARDVSLVWHSLLIEDREHQPPQLAKTQLIDEKGCIKQDEKGKLFANADIFDKEGVLEANVVDVIDWPKGFVRNDFQNSRLESNTVPFEFPLSMKIKPSKQLRILTPVACLKSRLENAFGQLPCKRRDIEAKRIEILLEPLELYLQYVAKYNGFRALKINLDRLLHVFLSRPAKLCEKEYGFDFSAYYEDVCKAYAENESFLSKELLRQLEKLRKT